MENEHKLHRCVTEFMLDTCCYTKACDRGLVCTFVKYMAVGLSHTADAFISGSSAEFYINPILSCIADKDVMVRRNNFVAMPAGHAPPTELPDHFNPCTTLLEIVPSHQPGYVYLKPSYGLLKTEKGRHVQEIIWEEFCPRPDCNFETISRQEYMQEFVYHGGHFFQSAFNSFDTHAHGPAFNLMSSPDDNSQHSPNKKHNTHIAKSKRYGSPLSVDGVSCIQCVHWPPQAADWPIRSRNYGVPDQATIDKVVNDGCDVVGAVHPRCRQDEWMNKYQWRLSFSRAEVTLLNSWTPVQQVIYHMLRYVVKREVLSKTDDNSQHSPKLSNYHIKTLMLWECEQKPQSWWSAESSLIKLCSSLIHKLSDWVEDKHCQHYFISSCNLLDHLPDIFPTVCYDLKSLADSSVLLAWFVSNYARACAQLCPRQVSALFDDIHSTDELERALHAVADWNLNRTQMTLYDEHVFSECLVHFIVHTMQIDATQLPVRKMQLLEVSWQLRDYFIAVISLKVAYTITIYSLTVDHLEMLWMLYASPNAAESDMVTSRPTCAGMLSISKAIKLATLSDVRSDALEMLHNEMSKAYLHHSFTYGQESTYCVVHVLLAALYYKSGHYRSAIDHCKQVLSQCDREQYGSHCIGAEYLPQIDESVDAVFGLVLLYQHLQRKVLNSDGNAKSDSRHRPAFTTQLLARYLYSKCSTMVTGGCNVVKSYRQHLFQTRLVLLSDVLLYRATVMQLNECTDTPVFEETNANAGCCSMDASFLLMMLEKVALEKLVMYRQPIVRELFCKQCPVLNEFEILYAYNCGSFEKCAELCGQKIQVLLRSCGSPTYKITFPELTYLLEGELVSFYGLIRLLFSYQICQVSGYTNISLLTVLLYLLVRCQTKLRSESLRDTMNLICHVHNQVFRSDKLLFDRLVLKLTYRSVKLRIITPDLQY